MRPLPPRRLLCALLTLAAAAAFMPQLWAEDARQPAGVQAALNAHGLAALMKARTSMVVLDARGTQSRFIPGAKACAPNASAATIARLAPRKDTLVITYGGSASDGLGQKLADRLARERYPHVIRLRGGVQAWTAARLKMAKKAPARAPRGSGRRGSGGR